MTLLVVGYFEISIETAPPHLSPVVACYAIEVAGAADIVKAEALLQALCRMQLAFQFQPYREPLLTHMMVMIRPPADSAKFIHEMHALSDRITRSYAKDAAKQWSLPR